jgi:hypothetical protein
MFAHLVSSTSSHVQNRAIELVASSAKKVVSLVTKQFVVKKRAALLGEENDMQLHLRKLLRHEPLRIEEHNAFSVKTVLPINPG